MLGGLLRLIAAIGSVVSGSLAKHNRYVPGLDEAVDILKGVAPIVAISDHPDAPEMAMKINSIIEKTEIA